MHDDDRGESKGPPRKKLSDGQIKTVQLGARRSFLRALGGSLMGAVGLVIVGSNQSARAADKDDEDSKVHHDFPKTPSNDDDVSRLADIKHAVDNDENDGFGDDDVSHLRDAKGSQDND